MRQFIVLMPSASGEVQWMLLFAKALSALNHSTHPYSQCLHTLCLLSTKHWPRFWKMKINHLPFSSQGAQRPHVDKLLHSHVSDPRREPLYLTDISQPTVSHIWMFGQGNTHLSHSSWRKLALRTDNASHSPSCLQNAYSRHDEYEHMLDIRLYFTKIEANLYISVWVYWSSHNMISSKFTLYRSASS